MAKTKEDPNEAFCCPSRGDGKFKDRWLPSSRVEGVYHCSYCGSIRGADFITMLEDGREVTATDKDYKIYVGDIKFYFFHFSTKQAIVFQEMIVKKNINFKDNIKFYVSPRLLKD